MSRFLHKYKRGFAAMSLMLVMVFGLSSVSIAYTSIFCKMKKAEMEDMESCCCKVKEKSEEKCADISYSETVKIDSPEGCCCTVNKSEATERKNIPLSINHNTSNQLSYEGSVLYEIPSIKNIPIIEGTHFDNNFKSGRDVLTFNSILRI